MSNFLIGAAWMAAIVAALWLGFANWGEGGGWAIVVAVILALKSEINFKFKASETE